MKKLLLVIPLIVVVPLLPVVPPYSFSMCMSTPDDVRTVSVPNGESGFIVSSLVLAVPVPFSR